MSWIFIAILAHFFWAWVNVGDKYVVENKVKNPYVYMVWLAALGAFTLILIPFVDFQVPDMDIIGWLVLASFLYLYGGLPYIRAMKIEEVTRINIWWQLIPVFSFVIAWMTLGEKLEGNQVLAMMILVFGGILASLHFKGRVIRFSKAFGLMIISCLMFSTCAVIVHYVASNIPHMVAFIWMSLLIAVMSPSLLLWQGIRKDFKQETRRLLSIRSLLLVIILIALFDNIGLIFNIWALSLGPVALVYAMEGWQVLFVFIIALVISVFYPKLLKEELDTRNLVLKLMALGLMIVGVVMVNLT